MMTLLLQAAEVGSYSISLGLVGVIGFIAAVTIGSIAWYNSKRPAGWEAKERPDVIPEIDKEDVPTL